MQVDHFLDKNKDFVVKEHQDLLAGSSLPLVARTTRCLLLNHFPQTLPCASSDVVVRSAGFDLHCDIV